LKKTIICINNIKQIKLTDVVGDAESTEFAGKCISHLANDPKLMSYSSKILIAAEYAQAKSIRDIDGRVVPSHRQINSAMKLVLPKSLHFVSNFVPNFVKVPQIAFDLMASKF
jgi:hypothetical protein